MFSLKPLFYGAVIHAKSSCFLPQSLCDVEVRVEVLLWQRASLLCDKVSYGYVL